MSRVQIEQVLLIAFVIALVACAPPVSTATSTRPPTMTHEIIDTPTTPPTLRPSPTTMTGPGLVVTLSSKFPSSGYQAAPAFSDDGQLIVLAGPDVRVWSVASHELLFDFAKQYGIHCSTTDAKFSPSGQFLAINVSSCSPDQEQVGHLLAWDLTSGEQVGDWPEEYAFMPPPTSTSWEYHIPVSGIAFVPGTAKILYPSGHTLQLRDLSNSESTLEIELGEDIFATQIGVSQDGATAYVIMDWQQSLDFPSLYSGVYELESWSLATHKRLHRVYYPQGWARLGVYLMNNVLVIRDNELETSRLIELDTNQRHEMPFRMGWADFNSDGSLMAVARYIGVSENEQGIEIWDTQSGKPVYVFNPDFGYNWYYNMDSIVFSPNNSLIAISHQGKVSLWNIGPALVP